MRRWLYLAGRLTAVCASTSVLASTGLAATISERTPVKVKLGQQLRSGHDRKGDRVRFVVAADVKAKDQTVLISRGTPAVGTVIRSTSRRMFGQPGRLEFTIDYISVGGGQRVPLRTTATAAKGHSNTAATVAGAVLLTPIALFVKGNDVLVKEGTAYTAFVDQTMEVPGHPSAANAIDAAKKGAERLCVFRLKDGRTVSGVLESFQAGTYFVGTDLGRLQISQDKVQSIRPAE
jgi:hypothetical protein